MEKNCKEAFEVKSPLIAASTFSCKAISLEIDKSETCMEVKASGISQHNNFRIDKVSWELMFVCVKKDSKQCFGVINIYCILVVFVILHDDQNDEYTIKICDIAALFGIFLETNKH